MAWDGTGTPVSSDTPAAFTALSTLTDRVRKFLRGAEANACLQALRESARRFCRDTEVWRETMSAITTAADDTTYALAIPTGYAAAFLRVERLTLDGTDVVSGGFTFGPDYALTLAAAPKDGQSLVAYVVFLPTLSCESYPDWLVARWGDGIAAGAVAILREQPGMPWSDAAAAQSAWLDYGAEVARAKREGIDGRRSGDLYATFPNFF